MATMVVNPRPKDAKAYAKYITALDFRVQRRGHEAVLEVVGTWDLRDFSEELEYAGFTVVDATEATYDLAVPIDLSIWMGA
jgi:predicted nuclease of restriction endonuclease-like RecB superfamily